MSEMLKGNILAECEEDHVGLWSVVRDVEASFPQLDEASVREHVLRLLSELLRAHEIEAGFPTANGGFRPLSATFDKIIEQIESDWPPGRRPTIGESLWFTRSKQKGRT